MDDTISRKAAAQALIDYFGLKPDSEYGLAIQDALNGLPTIDAYLWEEDDGSAVIKRSGAIDALASYLEMYSDYYPFSTIKDFSLAAKRILKIVPSVKSSESVEEPVEKPVEVSSGLTEKPVEKPTVNANVTFDELDLFPRGKWMDTSNINGLTYGVCSKCLKVRTVDNFCSNCGSYNKRNDISN